jgi:hypothetical protein
MTSDNGLKVVGRVEGVGVVKRNNASGAEIYQKVKSMLVDYFIIISVSIIAVAVISALLIYINSQYVIVRDFNQVYQKISFILDQDISKSAERSGGVLEDEKYSRAREENAHRNKITEMLTGQTIDNIERFSYLHSSTSVNNLLVFLYSIVCSIMITVGLYLVKKVGRQSSATSKRLDRIRSQSRHLQEQNIKAMKRLEEISTLENDIEARLMLYRANLAINSVSQSLSEAITFISFYLKNKDNLYLNMFKANLKQIDDWSRKIEFAEVDSQIFYAFYQRVGYVKMIYNKAVKEDVSKSQITEMYDKYIQRNFTNIEDALKRANKIVSN